MQVRAKDVLVKWFELGREILSLSDRQEVPQGRSVTRCGFYQVWMDPQAFPLLMTEADLERRSWYRAVENGLWYKHVGVEACRKDQWSWHRHRCDDVVAFWLTCRKAYSLWAVTR